jgi:hypothetical protein
MDAQKICLQSDTFQEERKAGNLHEAQGTCCSVLEGLLKQPKQKTPKWFVPILSGQDSVTPCLLIACGPATANLVGVDLNATH